MLKVGRNFQYEVPEGWQETRDGSRWMYHGPRAEQLIISSASIEGTGSGADRRRAEDQLLANAMESASAAAVQDGLVNTLSLRKDEAITEVSCWSFISETPAKDVIFLGAVAATSGGVLLVTLEAPWGPEPLSTFRTFLKSLRRPTS